MKKILHVISSPKGTYSYSIKLSNAIVERLVSSNPGSYVVTRDLTNKPFPHLEEAQITSFFTPPDLWNDGNRAAVRHSDEVIKELMEADVVVIGVPMYNFGISSMLKAWIDHIVRAGVTFRFLPDGGYEGLVHNKKAYLAIATGGIYSEGAMKSYDFTEPYLRAILGFLGITDITALRVEGTAIPGMEQEALQKAINSIRIGDEQSVPA